jgi:hypothetical protein
MAGLVLVLAVTLLTHGIVRVWNPMRHRNYKPPRAKTFLFVMVYKCGYMHK